jgi:hypothetical protein
MANQLSKEVALGAPLLFLLEHSSIFLKVLMCFEYLFADIEGGNIVFVRPNPNEEAK